MKTFIVTDEKTIKRNWYLIDLKDKVLGRVSSQIARILMGKNKVIYTPHIDCGDYVVATNARRIKVTGEKLKKKVYYRHSGYPGGLKQTTLRELLSSKPEAVIQLAVKRMLPKNKLGRRMLKRLKVYPDEKHHHQAQKPILI